jgi:hypothetical protein
MSYIIIIRFKYNLYKYIINSEFINNKLIKLINGKPKLK